MRTLDLTGEESLTDLTIATLEDKEPEDQHLDWLRLGYVSGLLEGILGGEVDALQPWALGLDTAGADSSPDIGSDDGAATPCS